MFLLCREKERLTRKALHPRNDCRHWIVPAGPLLQRQWNWLVDFAYLSHSPCIRVQKGDRCIHSLDFCFGAEWMRSVLISTSLSSLICSWLASQCSQRSPSQQRFPWALQLKEQILKEQITDGRVFFKMPFHPCPSGCDLAFPFWKDLHPLPPPVLGSLARA